MQFSVIGQWLIDGKSPHTGQPVLETCRVVKPGQGAWYYFDGRIRSIYTPSHLISYQVGKNYAIQYGRGQKSVGRTPVVERIYRQDVREMTGDDATARGFCSVLDYLQVWVAMHDPRAHSYLMCDLGRRDYQDARAWQMDHANEWGQYLRGRAPENFDAWVLRFAAPSGTGEG